jgi:hypothetical protein
MAYWLMTKITQIIETTKKISPHGVVKRDWLPTGRVDFTTRLNGVDHQNKEQPGEFKLLVEEWRMVESLTGNENLEIQWRLATLSEAKAVVSHYHKHLSENGLIKSIPELSASSFSVKRELSYRPTNGGSEAVSQPTQSDGARQSGFDQRACDVGVIYIAAQTAKPPGANQRLCQRPQHGAVPHTASAWLSNWQ